MKEIDARGLACPAPVLQTKAVIEEQGATAVRVIIDNEASLQNVQRFLDSQEFKTTTERSGNDFVVIGSGKTDALPQADKVSKPDTEQKKIMVMVATDRMGYGDDDLGFKLMVNFIKTLNEMGPELWRLVFINNGVKLTIEGSEVLTVLKAYEETGLHILVCGTCLDHFNLLDKKQVGQTTNMLDIVTAMQLADKVINI